MIQSELLKEKYRIQKILSAESASVHEYLQRSHFAAKTIANSYGFSLQYVDNNWGQKTSTSKSKSTQVR